VVLNDAFRAAYRLAKSDQLARANPLIIVKGNDLVYAALICSQLSGETPQRTVRLASGNCPFSSVIMFGRTVIVSWKKTSQITDDIDRNQTACLGLESLEAPGVEPVFPEKGQAINYAETRVSFRSGEIRILD
jgi:hypothetical protein